MKKPDVGLAGTVFYQRMISQREKSVILNLPQ